MAPPPKYLIERKLIRSISKKMVPKTPLMPEEYKNSLLECWRLNGVGSNKCVEEEQMFEFVSVV